LKVLDERELVVEVEKTEDIQRLQKAVQEAFQGKVDIETILKR
jgi:hypothetical protein